MKAAAIYARVSTADQVAGTSLDSQVKACREYAAQRGYSVVEAGVVTEDISGTVFNRPGLKKLEEMAVRKEIDAVLLAKVDRLARGRVVDALLESELRALGVDVMYVNRDTTTPEGRLLVNIEKDFAEWERERIMERTWGGKLDRANQQALDPNQGIMAGRIAPYGYEFVVVGTRVNHSRIVPIRGLAVLESEAAWMRKMFQWVAVEHCSIGEVVGRLNSFGVPTKLGRQYWERGTVRALLANSLYYGEWAWGKTQTAEPKNPRTLTRTRSQKSSQVKRHPDKWVRIQVPAIISRELFEAARGQLDRNRERAGRPTARWFLLRGLLSCSFCGRRLSGSKLANKDLCQYVCSGHRTARLREICRCPYLMAPKVEGGLWAKISEYLSDEDVLFALIADRVRNQEHERGRDQELLAGLTEKEVALKRQRRKLADELLAEPPLIDRNTAQEMAADFDKRAKELEAAKVEVEARMRQREAGTTSEATIKALCARARSRLPGISEEDKRAWLEVLDVHGTVHEKRIDFEWAIGPALIVWLDRQEERQAEQLYAMC